MIVAVTFIISTFIPQYFLQIIFGLTIGVLIGIIVCAFIHKENNH